MIIAMFLAHLVGDYILQWNSLAAWKSRALSGVVVHCLVVLAVTWLFIMPFNPGWWPWVLVIGLAHFAIDAFSYGSNCQSQNWRALRWISWRIVW